MPVRNATRVGLLAVLACFLVALAAPAVAAAASWEVDSKIDKADENPGDGTCKAEVAEGECTLRAAIEELNFSADATNAITFDPAVFDGDGSDTIFLGSQLQQILNPVAIDGGPPCEAANVQGAPCVGIAGDGGDPVFAVQADDTSISGLAISGGSTGIDVEASTGFEASGNWIGLTIVDTPANTPAGAGIYLGPGSDEAVIGGTAEADRNVFAFDAVGLYVEGASDAVVQGNWFGIEADGVEPGPAEVNIKITNYDPPGPEPEVKAEDNEIGAVLDANAQKSAECDGGCNVISAAGKSGIVLYGTSPLNVPASGPTTIHGNFLGLNPSGTAAVVVASPFYEGNRSTGVSAGSADRVTVGGDPKSEANYFAGGQTGVSTENSDEFEARGNFFGYSASGADATPQLTYGIFAFMATTAKPSIVSGNQIRMGEGGTGIQHQYIGATITGNTIEGGEIGISSVESGAPAGSLIEGNTIEDTGDNGIFLANPGNKVFGNEIFRAGGSGIELEAATDAVKENVIGGDSLASENAIFDSDGWAILIHGTEGSRNEIRRNHGSGNEGEGPFIVLRTVDVVENEKDPNGIKRPTISAAGKTEANGKSEPNAVVRVFFKASEGDGDLGGFLGKATADPSGNWKVLYEAPVPGETLVTATQTKAGGTSDLADVVKTPLDPPPPTPSSGSGSTSLPATPPPDTTKPKVSITKAPKAKSSGTTAKFKFSSDEAGSTFQCKLDNKAFARCASPKTYKKLKPGKHTFKVKAVDAAGNASAVVSRKFEVLG